MATPSVEVEIFPDGSQSSLEQDAVMFPEVAVPSVQGNLEEVVSQAALVESSHSGTNVEQQMPTTAATIQSVGMDELRRVIADKEKAIDLKVAEGLVRKDVNEDTTANYEQVLRQHQGAPQKHAMEKAVVDIISPTTLRGFFTNFQKEQSVKDLVARNFLYEKLTEFNQNATFWEKVLTLGRELLGFVNTIGRSQAISEALERKNLYSNWVNDHEIISEFRAALSTSSPEKQKEMIQVLIHGLERTSRLFGDKNAAQAAENLTKVLTQTKGESVDISIFDTMGLPFVTAARVLVKAARLATDLGKPAEIATRVGNPDLAANLIARDAVTGSKISGLDANEQARRAFSMGETYTESMMESLGISQKVQKALKEMATKLRGDVKRTLMPSSVTPAQVSRGAEYYDNLYDPIRNQGIYDYRPTGYADETFTGEIKWQKSNGTTFATKEEAELFGKEEGKIGVPEQVGKGWEADEVPPKVGEPKRVYASGGKLDVTGKVRGGFFPEPPMDTAYKFFLYGPTRQDKQGRFYRDIQEYAAPGQQWVFKETIKHPLPYASIGTHTVDDVAGRNWWNFGIPALAASIKTVTQRGLARSAQAKIMRGLEREYKEANLGLSADQKSLVDKALIEGDALSDASGSVGYVFNAIELGSRGLSEKGIESYYRMRILRDTGWMFRTQTMTRELRAEGMMEMAFDGNEFSQALHTPAAPLAIGVVKSMNTQGKVGKVLNTVDGKVLNLTSENIDALYQAGGQVVRLKKPQIVGNRRFTHLIIDPNTTKMKEITFPIGYRPGEFARAYTDEYFITVKKNVVDEFDRKPSDVGYSGEVTRTLRTSPSARDARTFIEAHQEALRIAFLTDLNDAKKLQILEQKIGKYTDPQEFLADTKAGRITEDEIFDFHYTRETHSYLQDTIDEGLSNGRLFTSPRGGRLLSTDPKKPNTMDIRRSLGMELANISRYMTSEDIRVTAIEKWINSFGHGVVDPSHNKMADFWKPLDGAKLKQGLLALKGEGKLSAGEDLTQFDSATLLKFAESERNFIKNQLHLRSPEQKINEELYRKRIEWLEGKLHKVLPPWLGPTMRKLDFPDFIRAANFEMMLGGGNLSQVIVQSMGALISMSTHPLLAVQSVKTAALLRLALMSDNPKVWAQIGTFDSLSSLGLKKSQDFLDSVKAMRDSGILADIKSTALYNVEDGALDIYKGLTRQALTSVAHTPFNRGEEFSRLVSWEISRRDWMLNNPGKLWTDPLALRNISTRQKEFNLGMQSYNTAWWQRGWKGLPFVFLQYNIKLAAAQINTATNFIKAMDTHGIKAFIHLEDGSMKFFDPKLGHYRMFTPQQALSILGFQYLFFGINGNVGLRGLANEWFGGDKSGMTEGQKIFMAEGLIAGTIYTLTKMMDEEEPAKLALGKRLGSLNWYGEVFDKIVGDKSNLLDFAFGATKSTGVKVVDFVHGLTRLFSYDKLTPELTMDALSKFPEIFSGYSNALKAYLIWQNEGLVTSKDGTPVARINSKENLAALFGMPSVAVQEYYMNVQDSVFLKRTLGELAKEIHSIQLREWQAQLDGNEELELELRQLRSAMMPKNEDSTVNVAHTRIVNKILREDIWPGDTASQKVKREFIDGMDMRNKLFRTEVDK